MKPLASHSCRWKYSRFEHLPRPAHVSTCRPAITSTEPPPPCASPIFRVFPKLFAPPGVTMASNDIVREQEGAFPGSCPMFALTRPAYWIHFFTRFHCYYCGSQQGYASRRRNVFESHLLPWLFFRPARCGDCARRLYVPVSVPVRPRGYAV